MRISEAWACCSVLPRRRQDRQVQRRVFRIYFLKKYIALLPAAAPHAAAPDGGIISYNRANNLRLCVHLGLPWIMSRRLPSHMQFSHGPLLIIWHARQSSANLFRQPEPLWTSTDHELMRGCLQLVMHVAWTSTAARPCAMQHVDFQRALVMRAGSLTRSQISRIDSPPLRPPRGLQPELW